MTGESSEIRPSPSPQVQEKSCRQDRRHHQKDPPARKLLVLLFISEGGVLIRDEGRGLCFSLDVDPISR